MQFTLNAAFSLAKLLIALDTTRDGGNDVTVSATVSGSPRMKRDRNNYDSSGGCKGVRRVGQTLT
ncbi:MAG: hypothetical protein RMY16_13185 [Nostoc sp. DedQUE12b]|uniref:hypothetical protein n=1 Tax=Nostoc sp. DedQUE12b TaxID=3075398 RepID=UPI002AD3CCDF|nr:hypothetical protein [Nostoc sp. DedQUE12b]MDZ8086492.1 hypothetical protein [Nostoc sp. DedQUE12b]